MKIYKDLNHTIEEYFDRFEFPHVLMVRLEETLIEIRVNLKELKEELSNYFREFVVNGGEPDIIIHSADSPEPKHDIEYTVKKPEPGKTKIKEEYKDYPEGRIVRKRLTGMVFIFNGTVNLALGPALVNVNQIVNFVNNRFIEKKLNSGYLLLHAAGVSYKEKGIAICGMSGAGKSTLALHMMGLGTNFISNDRILIKTKSRLEMTGVAKYPRINPGTILTIKEIEDLIPEDEREELSSLTKGALWQLEQKYDLFVDSIYGEDRFQLSSNMDALVILNWKLGGGKTEISQIAPSDRYDLFPAFMKAPGLFFLPGEEKLEFSEEDYLRHITHCPVFEVTGGADFELAAEHFFDFMKQQGQS